MLLIFGLAGAALACVKAYNDLRKRDEPAASAVVNVVRQSAGVIFALAKAVFEVLSALQGRPPATPSPGPSTMPPTGSSRFGMTAGAFEGRA